jgi:PAS domain S-box-containing protein
MTSAAFAPVRTFAFLAVFALIAVLAWHDGFQPVEHALMDARFASAPRPASQQIVIVEIDARSLNALATWPWPRQRHAELIHALVGAGADRIAFDVDFSSPSAPENDAALAHAIHAAGGRIILPAFGQRETTSHENTRTLSSEPLAAFRDHALIGHVNIWPLGSMARTVRAGAFFGTVYRPAMAALLSDQPVQSLDERYIDFSIDPKTIPRISFSDVLLGAFDERLVRGKTILIGGTAIELGDRLPVPVFGVLPGVTVQAIAAESMRQNRAIVRTSPLISLILTFAVLSAFVAPPLRAWHRAGAAAILTCALAVAGAHWLQSVSAVSADIAPPMAAALFSALWAACHDLIDRARKLRAERARSAARQALITRIVEDSSDGIAAIDEAGRVVICNAQAAALFGTPLAALQGAQIDTFLPLSVEAFLRGSLSREPVPYTFEHSLVREGAEPAIAEVVVNRSLWETASAEPVLVVTLRDITARKRVEAEERRAAAERLMAERSKSLFIANMSHELRTPLNAIIGFTEILESETLGPLGNAKYREYAGIVMKSGHHLLEMVNNVLEISRLEAGVIKAERRKTDIESIAESAFAFIRNGRDYGGESLSFSGARQACAAVTDARLLKQILVNLLSNAVKFAPQGRKNSATVIARDLGGGVLRVTVEDNGVGMSEDLAQRVTELFFQGDGTFTRKHEGRGLGLYLVKKHVEILGGSLTFETREGEGTKVHVDLPEALPAAASATQPAA